MPITNKVKRAKCRLFVGEVILKPNAIAEWSTADIEATIESLVTFAENNAVAINNAIPEPIKSTATIEQKRFLLALVMMALAGL